MSEIEKMTAFNFSGIYEREEWMSSWKDRWISFRDLEGTDGYCTEEAAQEIRQRISDMGEGGIHFLDSGNYHYLSKFWLEKILRPFELVVFDRHSDMQPSALLPLTSCGNWLLEVMEEHHFLKKVWLIGPPGETLRQIPAVFSERLTGISEMESVREDTMDQMVAQLGQYPVYLSIDKDVLSVEESPTNWDQGSMMLETLLKWLKLLAGKAQIMGADVCGEVSENGSFMSLEASCRKNDRVNRRLAETLQGCMRQAVLP